MKYISLDINKYYFDLRLRILEEIYDAFGTEEGKLNVNELMKRTGRSRTAVHLALSSLKENGLITLKNGKVRLRRGVIRESVRRTS